MTLLTSADYPTIRAALDVSLDADLLPDSIIAMPIYLGAAEAEVCERVPDAERKTGAALQHVKNAAMLLAAAYLAPAIPGITSGAVAGFQYQVASVDWRKLASDLRGRAEQQMTAVLTPVTVAASVPTMFGLASGRRGR